MNMSWPTFTGISLEASKVRKKCKFSKPILKVQPIYIKLAYPKWLAACVVKRRRKEEGKRRKREEKEGKIRNQIGKKKKKNPCASFSSAQSSFFESIRNTLFRVKEAISTFVFMQDSFDEQII